VPVARRRMTPGDRQSGAPSHGPDEPAGQQKVLRHIDGGEYSVLVAEDSTAVAAERCDTEGWLSAHRAAGGEGVSLLQRRNHPLVDGMRE